MRYIKLYEAFKSDVLKNTLKFLANKVNKNTANYFLSEIKFLLNGVNIPISEIDENDIEYLKTSKAIKLKNTEKVDNNYELYCIKYWFSIKDGYLGKTGVGNSVIPFERVGNKFNINQFEVLKNIKNTGLLTPVENLGQLHSGDNIVGVFDSNSESRVSVSFGRVYIEDNSLYAFQNTSNGSDPSNYPEWSNEWEYSWSLGSVDYPNKDHHKLYKYFDDGEPLRYSDGEEEEEENVFEYNLPLTDRMSLRTWYKNENKMIENSDFAIVLYFDKLLSKESVTIKQKMRTSSREGALALMSDEEIKRININKFITELFKKYGITKEKQDFSKLNNMISNLVSGDFILFDIYSDSSIFKVKQFIDKIFKLASVDDDMKSNILHSLINDYKNSRNKYEERFKTFNSNFELIKDSEKNNLIKVFNDLLGISKKMNSYIKNYKIENIDDAILLYYKIKSIEYFITDRDSSKLGDVRSILSSFDRKDRVTRLVDIYGVDYDSDLDKEVILLNKYVDSFLK
jgi:hypothetical protein